MAKKWGLLYLAFYRQESDLIVVEGSRIINDALQAGTEAYIYDYLQIGRFKFKYFLLVFFLFLQV